MEACWHGNRRAIHSRTSNDGDSAWDAYQVDMPLFVLITDRQKRLLNSRHFCALPPSIKNP
jgi:hypothetical protein